MSRTPDDFNSSQQDWRALVDSYCEGMLPADELAQLDALLVSDPEIRREFIRLMQVHTLLGRHFSPPQPAQWPEAEESKSEVGGRKSVEKPARPTRPLKSPPAPIPDSPILNPQSSILNVLRHPATFWSLLGFVVVGMLAIVYWATAGRGPGPVATAPSAAATLVRATDAKWQDDIAPAGDALAPGQRLKLNSGSVTIAFKSQARIIVDGPAELTIVNATACRLSNGRLTAQVPKPAKGFKVHTPDGTVTDLGTEFGVFVKAESGERKADEAGSSAKPIADGRQPTASSTEVHVFKGKVDLIQDDQLAQSPPDQKSEIINHKSQILSAGEAVTISENKVQPLPAADPSKFALDKLNGKSETVLLAEDFESYDVGAHNTAIGPWIVQTGIRKGQGVFISDLSQLMAAHVADRNNPVPNLSPPPPVGQRAVNLATAAQNPKTSFPLLAREIDGRKLTAKCQVLVGFDLFLNTNLGFEPSLAFGTEVGHLPGIELWRDSEGKRVEWPPYQAYRVRILIDVVESAVHLVRVERSQWRGSQGWQRDLTFEPSTPNGDWSTPPRYAIFGYPVVTPATPAAHMWLDNIRIEVISH